MTKGYRPSAPLAHEQNHAPRDFLDQLEEGAAQGAQAMAVRSAVVIDRSAPPPAAAEHPTRQAPDDSAWLAWAQQTLVLQIGSSERELPAPLALYRLCLAWVERREARALDPQDGRVLLHVQGPAAQGVPGLVDLLSAMFQLHLAELPRQAVRIVREHAAQPQETTPAAAPDSPREPPQAVEPGNVPAGGLSDDGKGAIEVAPPPSQVRSESTPSVPPDVRASAYEANVPHWDDLGSLAATESATQPRQTQDDPEQGGTEAAEPRRERAADRRRRRGPPID